MHEFVGLGISIECRTPAFANNAAVSAVSASRPMRRKPLYARRRRGSAVAGSSATNSTIPCELIDLEQGVPHTEFGE